MLRRLHLSPSNEGDVRSQETATTKEQMNNYSTKQEVSYTNSPSSYTNDIGGGKKQAAFHS